MTADQLYGEIILDYYRNPRNFGSLENPDAVFKDVNPMCGDVTEMQLKIDDGKIMDVKYTGKGCAISFAASGMLTELVKGKAVEEALKLSKEDILQALGIPISALRLKCALLGLKVFKYSLYRYLGESVPDENPE